MKGLKMKPSLGNIKSDDGLGRDFNLKKKERERETRKKKKRGKKKEKLLKIEYGLTHGLSMLFSPSCPQSLPASESFPMSQLFA